MGELHLEIIVDRMKREFGVEANGGQAAGGVPRDHPQDGQTRSRASSCKSVRRSSGQYGHVVLKIEPLPPGGAGFEFLDAIKGGVVPREFIPAVEKGIREDTLPERACSPATRWST